MGNDTIQQLLSQLRSAWLTTKQLPASIRHLFRGNRLTSLERGVLEAFVIEKLRLLEKQRVSDNSDTASLELNIDSNTI